MKENLHDIDKLFKAALDDHNENPPAAVWDAIDKNLDKNTVIDINKKYIKVRRIAIALLVLLLGAGIYTLMNLNKAGKAINNYTDNSSRNNEQPNRKSNLTEGKTSLSKKAEPTTAAPVNENTRVNQAEAGVVAVTPTQVDKSVLNDAPKEIKRQDEQIVKKAERGRQEYKNELKQSADNNDFAAFTKTTKQLEKENSKNAVSRKIITKKGWQKAGITGGGISEEDNKEVSTVLQHNEQQTAGQLEAIPLINPEIIKPIAKTNFSVISENNVFKSNTIKLLLPGKQRGKIKTPSFAATFFFAPNIASNNIKDEKHEHRPGSRPDNDDKDRIRQGEQHQSSTSFGVLLDYNINQHLTLQSGISVTNKSILIKPKTIYADKDDNGAVKYLYNCSSGYAFLSSKSVTNPVIGDSLQAFESTNKLQYMSIPLAVKYTWSFNKIDLFTSVGTAVNILTNGKLETEIEDGLNKQATVSNKINGLKPAYMSGNISVGAAYNFNDKFALSFTPVFNFALASSTKDAAVKTYPNSIGLAAGIRYKL
jgi:hypothetical protein